ncbi:MAG: nickel pincer cofactor biosynthesis protein LarB [Actinomycetota bacterium]
MADIVDERALTELLDDVATGQLPADEALERLRDLPYEALDDLRIDHHRELRTGAAEAVLAQGKTPRQVVDAARALAARGGGAVLVTRADATHAEALSTAFPDARHAERSGLWVIRSAQVAPGSRGRLVVVTAGTSDLPVAEEASVAAEALGHEVERITDVGVAGVHRVLEHRGAFDAADAVIVVAGMEGALPSVIGGLTSAPVVAVPTSVGYGASFEGLAALLGMLSSCAPGIAVVNIDNGFGAAQVAHRIVRTARARSSRAGSTD